jgi:hypothetical protein
MPDNIIPTHYRRQNDITQDGRNPEFVIGLAVYLDQVIDENGTPSGSINLEMGPLSGLGEKRALNHHPSNVEMYAALHNAMSSLMGDPEVKKYVESLAKLVKQQQINKRFEDNTGMTPLQAAQQGGRQSNSEIQRIANEMMRKLG